MSTITKITAYKTTDGKLWDDRNDAANHQLYLEARAMFDDATDCDGRVVFDTVSELRDWLTEHSSWVLPLMGWKEDTGSLAESARKLLHGDE